MSSFQVKAVCWPSLGPCVEKNVSVRKAISEAYEHSINGPESSYSQSKLTENKNRGRLEETHHEHSHPIEAIQRQAKVHQKFSFHVLERVHITDIEEEDSMSVIPHAALGCLKFI